MTRPHFKALTGSTALWICLSGTAIADVSALDVWNNWKSYGESFGQEFTIGSQNTDGGTLSLKDITISMDFGEGQISGTLGLIEFRERSDGTVAITMSPDYLMTMSIDPPEEEQVDMEFVFSQLGMTMVASGSEGAISYDYLAAEMKFALNKLLVDGEEVGVDASFAMSELNGKYSIVEGDLRQISSKMNAAGMTFDVNFTDPDDGTHFELNGNVADLSSQSEGQIPNEIDMNDPTWIFNSDFAVSGGVSAGPGSYNINVVDESGPFSFEGSSATSSLDFDFGEGMVAYGGATTDTHYRVSGAQIPLPQIELSLDESAFKFKMPLGKSDTPQDFGFLTKLIGLSVSDDIWGMIDPGKVLPREPATLILDIAGKMNWLVDITDPEAMVEVENNGEMPALLHSMTISDVTMSIAGAEVNATGDFAFDNSDLTTFDGMPAPTGTIDVNIFGVNGLMDRLTQMGLLPQEQAMGARMMLGLFARPADGPDSMTSKIEVNGDGSVFANGQQLK